MPTLELGPNPKCTFVTDPTIDKVCKSAAPWEVYITVGTGHYRVEEPFRRCNVHLKGTLDTLIPGTYETGWFEELKKVKVPY